MTDTQSTLTDVMANSTATPSASAPRVHTVTVGKGTHRFVPDNLTASVGDVVTFEFFPLNHSVVRAQYGYPCVPYEDVVEGQKGFFSGLVSVSEILSDPPTWNLTINDTSPVFFYCSAPGSCIDYQMVGAINPNSSTSIHEQKQLAKHSDYMLQPGEGFPSEASASLASAASAASTGLVTASSTISTIAQSPPSSPSGQDLRPAAIAGIVIGVVGLSSIMLGLVTYILFRVRERNDATPGRSSIGSMPDKAPGGAPGEAPGEAPEASSPISPCSPWYQYRVFSPVEILVEKDSNDVHELGEG